MGTEMRIYLANGGDVGSLRDWLADLPGVHVAPVPASSRPGEQGDVWEFLSVLCGTGGAVTVTANAVKTWLESRVTEARVAIGEVELELRGTDPETLARLIDVANRAADRGR